MFLYSNVMENYNKEILFLFFFCIGELIEFFFFLKLFFRVEVFCFKVGEKIGGLKKDKKFNMNR